jgi:hypothetical protein
MKDRINIKISTNKNQKTNTYKVINSKNKIQNFEIIKKKGKSPSLEHS